MVSLEAEFGFWDLVLLEPLNDENLVANIHQRFNRDHIYTYIGSDLISLNPFRKLALYSTELVRLYMAKPPYNLPPHVYAITSSAYRWLKDHNEDQVVLISGESSSGKTEVSRIALQFIVLACSNDPLVNVVKDRLVHANTLLEAFGNAKTYRNDNSSRFGKFLDIEFDFKGDPVGGHITHFLLEKTRVTSLTTGDRNFHCFYQLVSGADITFLKSLKLKRNLESYRILNNFEESNIAFLNSNRNIDNDRAHYSFTRTAMQVLGFTPDEIIGVFQIIAVILKLGNLTFLPSNNMDGTETCTITNDYELEEICHLLDMDMTSLQTALTVRVIETAVIDLTEAESAVTRDLVCRCLYNRLFTWLVNRVNDGLKTHGHARRRMLGIVDLYGFQQFHTNNLEVLFINYCNELLHRTIVASTLTMQQEELVREGLEWTHIDYFDNGVICELIDKKSHGVLSTLEETHADDGVFLSRLKQCCSGHTHCSFIDQSFQIHHYAGAVTYNARSFIEKNREHLPRNVAQTIYKSKHALVKQLFPEGDPKRGCVKCPVALSVQLKISMNALVKQITARHAHYIRCVVPNASRQPRKFDVALVQHQLHYLDVLATIALRRNAYAYRMAYGTFLQHYRMLSGHTWPRWPRDFANHVEIALHLIRALPLPHGEFQFGRTKLFIRSPRTLFELEGFRSMRLHDLAREIQRAWRGYRQRKRYHAMIGSQIIISRAWRKWRESKMGAPYSNCDHLWDLSTVAKEEARMIQHKKRVDWAVKVIQRHYIEWKRRQYLLELQHKWPSDVESPTCREWPTVNSTLLTQTNILLNKLYHKWRCHKYRLKFDQTARNRMREKVTASILFKNRKASYARSISHPFVGDYVRLRQNMQWKKLCIESNDQYVVFADIINKITRSSGKFVPILLVISTSAMLILDQRTLQIKYRVPATEIYRLSLSPFLDDVAVFHIRASSEDTSTFSSGCANGIVCNDATQMDATKVVDVLGATYPHYYHDGVYEANTGCLFQGDFSKKKGDFVFQTGHVIEIVTKLFLVVQNAVGKPPDVNISTEFEANFGQQTVIVSFKCASESQTHAGQIRVLRKGNRMDIVV